MTFMDGFPWAQKSFIPLLYGVVSGAGFFIGRGNRRRTTGVCFPCLQEEMLLRAECLDAKQEEGF